MLMFPVFQSFYRFLVIFTAMRVVCFWNNFFYKKRYLAGLLSFSGKTT